MTERNQEWTYFGCFYFSYTSLLTIGYGDFRPQSNSGKAFFVFWTLLAVPSLTILISNMGDTIIKGIRDLTLWLGTITVLPGDKNKKDVLGIGKKVVANVLKRKANQNRHHNEQVATSPGNARTNKAGDQSSVTLTMNDTSHSTQQESTRVAYRKQIEKDIEKGKVQYHLLLVKEIAEVIKHVNAKPAREYNYDEWIWYLKLAGEDDTNALFKTSAIEEEVANDEGGQHSQRRDREDVKWTWLSESSPLMGDKCETEWILDKLTRSLQRELEGALKAQSDQLQEKV